MLKIIGGMTCDKAIDTLLQMKLDVLEEKIRKIEDGEKDTIDQEKKSDALGKAIDALRYMRDYRILL